MDITTKTLIWQQNFKTQRKNRRVYLERKELYHIKRQIV